MLDHTTEAPLLGEGHDNWGPMAHEEDFPRDRLAGAQVKVHPDHSSNSPCRAATALQYGAVAIGAGSLAEPLSAHPRRPKAANAGWSPSCYLCNPYELVSRHDLVSDGGSPGAAGRIGQNGPHGQAPRMVASTPVLFGCARPTLPGEPVEEP